jgi:uncharacterized damage-inducible protein DinB
MTLCEYARQMAGYNRWVNEHLYATCAELSDEARKRDVGAFFKSVHGTLNHLLLGDRMWLSRFTGESYKISTLGDELYADFSVLRQERGRTDHALEAWAATLTPAELAGELHYIGIAKPVPRHYPYWFALVHLFNHQTHHRGQITVMLTQLGVAPGATDLIALPAFNP